MAGAEQINSLAGQLGAITSSLKTLGLDVQSLQMTAAAFQLIGGTAQAINGLIAAKQAYAAIRAAEGAAQLIKYGPAAIGVAAVALAGGYAMGELIERTVNVDDNGAGLRMIAEAV